MKIAISLYQVTGFPMQILDHHRIYAAVLCLSITPSLRRYTFLDLSLLHLSELFSNSFIEKIFLKCKKYGVKSITNKSNQTYFCESADRFTTASALRFSGPFYPTLVDHITQKWTTQWVCISHYINFLEQSYRKKQIVYDNDRQIAAFKYIN